MITLRFLNSIPLLAGLLLSVPPAFGDDARVVHEINSEHTGRPQTIEVSLPLGYADHPESDFPVLVLLDGESNLDHTRAVAEYLASTGAIPELIVVGVHAGPSRVGDFAFVPVQAGMPAHGERYLDFVQREVLPLVEGAYRVAPLRIISGHSLGGAFITSALAERPDLFDAYIVQSPYLPGEFGAAILNDLKTAISAPTDGGVFYYANLGTEPDLHPSFTELVGIVEESSALRSATEVHPSETHMSTRLVGVYNGLKQFFEPAWRFDDEDGSMRGHVESLSTIYGYDILYAEAAYQQHIQRLLGAGSMEAAVDAAKLYAQQHGYSPVSHLLLAVALARSGDLEGARAAIRDSIERYDEDPRAEWASVQPSIRALAAQLGVVEAPSL